MSKMNRSTTEWYLLAGADSFRKHGAHNCASDSRQKAENFSLVDREGRKKRKKRRITRRGEGIGVRNVKRAGTNIASPSPTQYGAPR